MSTEPKRLGKYHLSERLAHGGQGEVWKALDVQLRRYVAIKILHPDLQQDPDFMTRFEREAQVIASLHHPNIVKIHDFRIESSSVDEFDEATAYMVMDFVPGQTLADYIRDTSRQGHMPPAEDIVHIFTGICLALEYAHNRGMIHRDIKPANILLDERLTMMREIGEPVLTDFGIARLQGMASRTAIGSLLGTPLYISPEQAQGKQGDKRSDLYSLGVILYELMTGVTPFRGKRTIDIVMQQINDLPTPPILINPKIGPAVSAVIIKSLAKKPEHRFSNALEMAIALAESLAIPVPRSLLTRTSNPPSFSGIVSTSPISPVSLSQQGFSPVLSAQLQQTPDNIQSGGSVHMPQRAMPPNTPFTHPIETPRGLPIAQQYPSLNAPMTPQTPLYVPGTVPPEPLPAAQGKKPGKRYTRIVILSLLIVLIVLGSGIGIFTVLARNGSPPAHIVVGSIQFSQSENARTATHEQNPFYDLIGIDLKNVQSPRPGYVYYAWIESPLDEDDRPHWRLDVNAGNVKLTTGYEGQNLFIGETLFLITEENASFDPLVPYTARTSRLYYALINPTVSTSFEVKTCPQTDTNNPCLG